ncbi:hypothetical protein D3C72_1197180 [compost metagenome]
MVQQVRREGVAQRVRRQRHVDAGSRGLLLHDDPEHHARHARAARGHEQVGRLLAVEDHGARFVEVAFDPAPRLAAEGHEAFLVALAEHAQHAVVQAHVDGLQRHQLAHAQAARVHQLQHRAVAQAERALDIGRGQQVVDLLLRQRLDRARHLARGHEADARVGRDAPLAQRPAVVALEHREPAVRRGRLALGGQAHAHVGLQVGLARGVQPHAAPLFAQPLREQREVAAVGGQRVLRQPVFEPESVDEGVDVGGGGSGGGLGHAVQDNKRKSRPERGRLSGEAKRLSRA